MPESPSALSASDVSCASPTQEESDEAAVHKDGVGVWPVGHRGVGAGPIADHRARHARGRERSARGQCWRTWRSTLDYEVNIFNLPSGIVASHIHAGTAGVNGPIVINFPVAAVGQSGAFQLKGSARASELIARPETGVRSFEELVAAIASGATYVNVHTQANPGGEIRGQLCPESAAANTINGVALCTQPRR
jgi:hypothetical protein